MVTVKFIAADAQMLAIATQLISYYCLCNMSYDVQHNGYLRRYDYKLDEADEQEDKSSAGHVCSESRIHLLRILYRDF